MIRTLIFVLALRLQLPNLQYEILCFCNNCNHMAVREWFRCMNYLVGVIGNLFSSESFINPASGSYVKLANAWRRCIYFGCGSGWFECHRLTTSP